MIELTTIVDQGLSQSKINLKTHMEEVEANIKMYKVGKLGNVQFDL